ncbi:hypothetical protein ERO13_D08G207450v2, partial [Gossypium hirsutum]
EKLMNLSATEKDLMIVNMGPHHPSMHGVLHLIVTLDGEDVVDCEPILGYLYRGMEKIAENLTIIHYLPYLGNIQVPKRASYIRVIMLELSRIASHLLWLGPFRADIGAQTLFFYIFRERELVNDLFKATTGMRMMHNYFHIGGVAADLPYVWIDKCLDFFEGIGVIGGEEAINWGLFGPMLRASGIKWDLRKVDHYECYDEFDWKIQWQKEGDSLACYLVRISEMTESMKIIQQFLEGISGVKKPSPIFELPRQELYARMEAPKGELIIFLIGDQSGFLWRWKIRPPGFINLQILPQLVKRMKLADIMTILGITIGVLVIVWLEREISVGIQQCIGPEYAGPLGILQALADGTKLLFKESRGNTCLFSIGPAITVISILLSFSIIPFSSHLILSDLNIGIFLWIPISSIASVGLLMLGYGSNNKYSFLGGLRAAAQSISYEIPLTLCVLSISLRAIR